MKTIKYILSTFLIISVIWSCTKDNLGNSKFMSSVVAPTEVDALFNAKQDNSGNVTIIPSSIGGVNYDVYFGDSTTEPAKLEAGESVTHTYAEATYEVKVVAYGITGLLSEVTLPLNVSFNAPSNVVIEKENDAAVSYKVNIKVTADDAISYDVYFGELGNDDPVSANVGDWASYTYAEAGIYTIRVVVSGTAIETTEEIFDFEATRVSQPIVSAPTPGSRMDVDVISIFSDAYTPIDGTTNFNPGWGQSTEYTPFDLNGDAMLQYSNLNYQGIEFGSDVDAVSTSMEYVHLDVWTPDLAALEFTLISRTSGEKFVLNDLVAEEWSSFDIPLSEFTDQGLTLADLFQIKFVGSPWAGDGFGTIFVDNIYFWKEPSAPSPLEGTWKVAPEEGAIAVGPAPDDLSWWYLNQWGDDVTARACWLDDEYIFSSDGTFTNVVGAETWLEPWQGVDPESCGAPIAPHDGSNPATWSSSDTQVTVSGLGAFLGLAKVHNSGEDGAPPSNSVTYDYVLSDGGNTMELKVVGYGGTGGTETWYMKLVKEVNPLVGTWKVAPEEGAIAVGPAPDDLSWWYLNQWGDDVTSRACWLDDEYIFSSDGTFMNVLGAETWLEPWQGVDPEACGAPIAPHNGSNPASWSSSGTSITVSGLGAYLGLAKVHNSGEDGAPPSNSVTYDYELSDGGNTMELKVVGYGGTGGTETWYFKMLKQ